MPAQTQKQDIQKNYREQRKGLNLAEAICYANAMADDLDANAARIADLECQIQALQNAGCGACGDACNGGQCKIDAESPTASAAKAVQPVDGEVIGETCIDGGKCHHQCTTQCFRRKFCEPLSGYAGPWGYAAKRDDHAAVLPSGFAFTPFIQKPDGWYFMDEVQDEYGPYPSQIDAAIALGGWLEKHHFNPHSVAVPDENDDENDSATAVIAFVLNLERTGHSGEGMEFLRLWNEGEFDVCRREWPDAPPECYIGADTLMGAAQKQEGVE